MTIKFDFKKSLLLLILLCLFQTTLSDMQSGFSQGCYSACPRKIWTLQNESSRQQLDRQWIQCLKRCHQVDSWKFIIIVVVVVVIIVGACILIEICWGEKILLKYTFHVERKKRTAIRTQDEAKVHAFEEQLRKFKQLIQSKLEQVCIEFENDSGNKKLYYLEQSLFQQRNPNELENMFSIIIYTKHAPKPQPLNDKIIEIQQQSQNEINLQQVEYSQLIGAISLTTKGINLWWIKVDDKPEDLSKWCTICSRRNQKYLAVYQKDPFAAEGSWIGNVVLQDSSKRTQQRYTTYVIKKRLSVDFKRFHQRIIEA